MEKIDFVIIWVDGNDKEWQKEKAKYKPSDMLNSDTPVRYRDWDNLQYWFRGVEKFTPWVNKIHFVTWGHLPAWLDTSNPKLNIVNHRDYIPEKYLPTFSSHCIELNLHRIKGLSDRFVYFNDDMFILKPMEQEEFFKNGMPCDTFGLNCVYFGHDSAGHFNGSNMEVINSEFQRKKRAIQKRDFCKWFSLKNGFRVNLKTAMLSLWEWFPGFHYDHLPSDFLKQTFEEVWDKYYDILDKTCSDKFRQESNVNQWLMKYWQLCTGNYAVRPANTGNAFHVSEENFKEVCRAVYHQQYKLICINDTPRTVDFEHKKDVLNACFKKILPEKSGFEL
ncbi:MAG: Stealth CR1 domain-containing protein [Clostridia bacterium]|nr:Stealth CR1 domain-containing protein [Clostridia bacterium]